jgi:hypothetical protein
VQTALYNGCEWLPDALESAGLANPPPVPPNYVESTGEANNGAVDSGDSEPELTGEVVDEVDEELEKKPIGLFLGAGLLFVSAIAAFLKGAK